MSVLKVICSNCQAKLSFDLGKMSPAALAKEFLNISCPNCKKLLKIKNPKFEQTVVEPSQAKPPEDVTIVQGMGNPAAKQAFLVLPDGKRLALKPGVNILGKNGHADHDINNADSYLSRRHCALELKQTPSGLRCILSDDGKHTGKPSTNGTFLNGKRLDPDDAVILSNGDTLRIGRTELAFVMI